MIQTLSEAEKEIMDIIWDGETPVTSSEILQRVNPEKNWKPQTVSTFLTRLVNKKYLKVEYKKGVTNYYSCLVDRKQYEQSSLERLFVKNYGGSLKRLVASLTDSDAVTENDIDELKKWLESR